VSRFFISSIAEHCDLMIQRELNTALLFLINSFFIIFYDF
jgi:hypothetical protein